MKKAIIITQLLCLLLSARSYAQTETPEMITIKGGNFLMGSKNNEYGTDPQHLVTLSSYRLAKYETTVLQWQAYCLATGQKMPESPAWGWQEQHPIVNLSLNNITGYLTWLNKKTGRKFRLPTEAEWEYAATGGSEGPNNAFSGSQHIGDVAWYALNSNGQTHPVGMKQKNNLGIYDMTGNVAEWCFDRYAAYPSGKLINPKGPETGFFRIVRGGSWYNLPAVAQNTFRSKLVASAKFDYLGFRLAEDL